MLRKAWCARRQDFILLLSIYSVSHFALVILLPNAVFWDDWTLWNVDSSVITETFRQLGAPWIAWLHNTLMTAGPWLYRVLTFLMHFIAGVCLYEILGVHGRWISPSARLAISIFFLILPFNSARSALITFPYTLSIACFFVAWWQIEKRPAIAFCLFGISFSTQSLLVFYTLPILHWILISRTQLHLNALIAWSLKRWTFIVLPFLVFALRFSFWRPSGHYGGYNEAFHMTNLVLAPLSQIRDLFELTVNVPLLFACFVVVHVLIKRQTSFTFPDDVWKREPHRIITWMGAAALFLGLFPYWILGLVPTFGEWTSRHQLLMPLGISLMIVGGIAMISDAGRRKMAVVLIIAFSLSVTWNNYWNMWVDARKRIEMIEFVQHSNVVRNATIVLVEDQSSQHFQKYMRFYEICGILRYALDDDSRFGVSSGELSRYASGEFDRYFSSLYNCSKHKRLLRPAAAVVRITNLSLGQVISNRRFFQFSAELQINWDYSGDTTHGLLR